MVTCLLEGCQELMINVKKHILALKNEAVGKVLF
jgi:hypothetical protein